MELTPIYTFIAVMIVVCLCGLVIIDHRPIRIILLAVMLGCAAIGFYLHQLT